MCYLKKITLLLSFGNSFEFYFFICLRNSVATLSICIIQQWIMWFKVLNQGLARHQIVKRQLRLSVSTITCSINNAAYCFLLIWHVSTGNETVSPIYAYQCQTPHSDYFSNAWRNRCEEIVPMHVVYNFGVCMSVIFSQSNITLVLKTNYNSNSGNRSV